MHLIGSCEIMFRMFDEDQSSRVAKNVLIVASSLNAVRNIHGSSWPGRWIHLFSPRDAFTAS